MNCCFEFMNQHTLAYRDQSPWFKLIF